MNIVEVKISANKESSYPIIIEQGLLDNAYEYIQKYTKANKFLVVTNDTIFNLYGEKLKAYLRKGAKPIRGEQRYPNNRTGWGALCVKESFPESQRR